MIELTKALIEARKAFKPVVKSKPGPRGKYADFGSIIESVEVALADHGLVIVQPIEGEMIHTILLHVSGERLESLYPIKIYDDSQKTGSAITYGRRYALCAMLNIVADDDDDGAASSPSAIRYEARKMVMDFIHNHPSVNKATVADACSKAKLPSSSDKYSTIDQITKLAIVLNTLKPTTED